MERKLIRPLILLGIIFVLLHLANDYDVMSNLSRRALVWIVQIFGVNAQNRTNEIVLGKLELPWTQDCSGINVLILLLGVKLWTNRREPFNRSTFVRLLSCVPASAIANVFRVLTIAAYRYIRYPQWESRELHFLIGFLCLTPFLFICVRDVRRLGWNQWLEIFYTMVVLSILTPLLFSPGGNIAALCALAILAQNRFTLVNEKRWFVIGLWVTVGLAIGVSRMESFWLPWLLVSPYFTKGDSLFTWTTPPILIGTIPLIAMNGFIQCILGVVLLIRLYVFLTGKTADDKISSFSAPKTIHGLSVLLFCIIPFLAPELLNVQTYSDGPPRGVMAKKTLENCYEIRLMGQPSDIYMQWYGAFNDGRHHSLPTCMRFRGITLKQTVDDPQIFTDGKRWYREYFIHQGRLYSTYWDYLQASFSPFSSPGAHIILEAPIASMNLEFFSNISKNLVNSLYELALTH